MKIDVDKVLGGLYTIRAFTSNNRVLRAVNSMEIVLTEIRDVMKENTRLREALEKISTSNCQEAKRIARNALEGR